VEFDCEVNYKRDYFEHPKKVKTPYDYKPGTKVPKLIKSPIWLVEIIMPKKLMQDIEQGALELASGTVDMEDIDQAYEEGGDQTLNQTTNIDNQSLGGEADAEQPTQ